MSAAIPEATFIVQPPVLFSKDRPFETATEFRVGIRSVPYLADHGFQDMVVLPGSFYIEMALSLDREISKRAPGLVRRVTFDSPVVLSAEDTVIEIETKDRGDGRVEYTFRETGPRDAGLRPSARRFAAKLEIDRSPSTSSKAGADAFSIETFQAQSRAVIDPDRLYGKLRENGNQYGLSFKNISSIWRAGDQSLGRLSVPHQAREHGRHYLHPILLDSMTQLLAPFVMEKGKTFVLRSIEKVEITDIDFPDTLWGHATLLTEDDGGETEIVGNVRIFDQSGKPYLELSGVAFALLDRVELADEKAAANLVIASNFTAEPIEDSLKFWGDHFGAPIRLEFAPYNQIFQQLLGPESAFRKNRDGVNIILLGLEEWATGRQHDEAMTLSKETAERCFGSRPRYVLPNGLEIAHLNRYETDYLYKEIFEDQCYLRHGIRLQNGATVVDIGANIGLFSLFVMSHCANPRIYAFEPAPIVYDLLKANCDAYGSNVRTLNVGVSDRPKTATFTFYEKSSVFSGFYSHETEDREAIQAVVRNLLNRESVAGESVEEYVDELTADRLHHKTHECRLTSVSDMIREHRIDRIDLLKIDAEKSELDIIKGIGDGDWPKIDQIVVEIHDPTRAAIKHVEELLIKKGFRCAVEQETLLERAGLFNLYATRREAVDEVRSDVVDFATTAAGMDQAHRAAPGLNRNIRDFCAALQSFMNRAAVPLILCFCPRTPAAAADTELAAALNDAEEALSADVGRIAKVRVIRSASPLRHHPVDDFYDPHGHHAGHVPYTQECYAAIGTELVRTLFNLKGNPFKVIVLDCDNTLWKGVCGEDGPLGIEVPAPYRALQEFMIGQMKAGMLLCLCSKNNEKDVLEVFDRRNDMPLKREHLVSWRINWKSKSENVKSLASELNLGLDSFIFVDDNPVECADVGINCPGVLTLQLPRNAESFPSFLNHIWAFDCAGATAEDQNRTRMYQESAQRQQFRERSFSLKNFVEGLQLRVEIAAATEEQFGRVSQLTMRTSQFNFTNVRRQESEIRNFLKSERAAGLAVRVADRFGDYGLVGVLMYETEGDRYKVDTLLLSCRVLGRGVEHALVSWLGKRAVKEGKRFIEFPYVPTGRNLPALEFITSIGDQCRNESGTTWTLPAERLASVEYDPDGKAPIEVESPSPAQPEQLTPRPALGVADRSGRLQWIGEKLFDIQMVMKSIEEYRIGKRPLPSATDVAPGTTLEMALANIWRKVLGRPRIGMNDNFFEAGGTSLRAVQVLAMIKKELKRSLSIVSLFECPTVALLAARLGAAPEQADTGTAAEGAAQRGQRRRRKTMMQRAS
jgi:FkbH-like protein/FkbM family methyltransferase